MKFCTRSFRIENRDTQQKTLQQVSCSYLKLYARNVSGRISGDWRHFRRLAVVGVSNRSRTVFFRWTGTEPAAILELNGKQTEKTKTVTGTERYSVLFWERKLGHEMICTPKYTKINKPYFFSERLKFYTTNVQHIFNRNEKNLAPLPLLDVRGYPGFNPFRCLGWRTRYRRATHHAVATWTLNQPNIRSQGHLGGAWLPHSRVCSAKTHTSGTCLFSIVFYG